MLTSFKPSYSLDFGPVFLSSTNIYFMIAFAAKMKLEGSYGRIHDDESSHDVSSPRDVNSPLVINNLVPIHIVSFVIVFHCQHIFNYPFLLFPFQFGMGSKIKEDDKLNRRKEKQRAKDDEKLEKKRQKEVKKLAEKEKEREKKKIQKQQQKQQSVTKQLSAGGSSGVGSSGSSVPTLADFVQSEDNAVPLLLEKCVKFIEEEGLDSEGIYRVPGNRAHVDLLFQKFEEGKYILPYLTLSYLLLEKEIPEYSLTFTFIFQILQ